MKKVWANINAVLIADNPKAFVTRRISEANLESGGIRGVRHFGINSKADSRQPMHPSNRRTVTVLFACYLLYRLKLFVEHRCETRKSGA
ncbi:hypothetical protein [Bacillus sp. ISL-7]|uniref:hypothetical protein n=1 Tax=Bacillus sp. ISL-7 TaxID=2819136 RepID=UPI001BE9402F|nr:hypothetical protein [Bacillus sp. ISL-7]MBT2736520.1 hypothetical protein [Bacillus sp. ISL-7]